MLAELFRGLSPVGGGKARKQYAIAYYGLFNQCPGAGGLWMDGVGGDAAGSRADNNTSGSCRCWFGTSIG